MTGEFGMEQHGLLDENEIVTCQYNDLVQGEYLAGVGFGYTSSDLVQLVFKTNRG